MYDLYKQQQSGGYGDARPIVRNHFEPSTLQAGSSADQHNGQRQIQPGGNNRKNSNKSEFQ